MTFLRKCLAELRARHPVEQFEAIKDRKLSAGDPDLDERLLDFMEDDEQNGVALSDESERQHR